MAKQSKFEKQYNQLIRRGIDVSPYEFKQYYDMTRRAKNKLRLIKRRGTLIVNVKLSNEVKWIQSRDDFDYGYNRLIDILSADYTYRSNEQYKKNFIENVQKLEGGGVVATEIGKMTPSEIRAFYEDNKDIDDFIFGSGDIVSRVADFLDITSAKILNRIEVFKHGTSKKVVRR